MRRSLAIGLPAALAVKEALAPGGNYGDIGGACGVSRQAARHRGCATANCTSCQNPLSGGPRDGQTVGSWC